MLFFVGSVIDAADCPEMIIRIAHTAVHEWRNAGMNDTEFENALKNVVRVRYGDDNDLILRGDALKAIRQRCISEHLPFKSNTPVGARVLDALAAVYQVKPYKDVCGKWVSVKDRLPEKDEYVLCFLQYWRWISSDISLRKRKKI